MNPGWSPVAFLGCCSESYRSRLVDPAYYFSPARWTPGATRGGHGLWLPPPPVSNLASTFILPNEDLKRLACTVQPGTDGRISCL
jgi:hypothetical protein